MAVCIFKGARELFFWMKQNQDDEDEDAKDEDAKDEDAKNAIDRDRLIV
jgi:hypothetical protein